MERIVCAEKTQDNPTKLLLTYWGQRGGKVSTSCRSRQEIPTNMSLQNLASIICAEKRKTIRRKFFWHIAVSLLRWEMNPRSHRQMLPTQTESGTKNWQSAGVRQESPKDTKQRQRQQYNRQDRICCWPPSSWSTSRNRSRDYKQMQMKPRATLPPRS